MEKKTQIKNNKWKHFDGGCEAAMPSKRDLSLDGNSKGLHFRKRVLLPYNFLQIWIVVPTLQHPFNLTLHSWFWNCISKMILSFVPIAKWQSALKKIAVYSSSPATILLTGAVTFQVNKYIQTCINIFKLLHKLQQTFGLCLRHIISAASILWSYHSVPGKCV